MRFTQTQTSFNSGQLSRKLDGRIDIKEYKGGCRELSDMVTMKTGGVRKLPGDFILTEEASNFEFFYSETYVFSDGAAYRFQFTSTSAVPNYPITLKIYSADSATPLQTIATNISLSSSASTLSLTQYEDTIWIATSEGTHFIRGIKFTAGTFSLDDTFDITAHTNPYHWPMELQRGVTISMGGGLVSSRAATISAGNFSDYVAVGEIVTILGVTIFDGVKHIALNYYEVISMVGPNAVLSGYFSGFGVAFDILDARDYGEFYIPAWGSKNGHPKVLTSDDGRLIAGGSPGKPATIYGSLVNDPRHFNNVRQPYQNVTALTYFGEIVNTDPYIFTLATQRTAQIKFMDSNISLIIGTDERIYVASGGDGIIGPLNIQIRPFNSKPASHLYTAVDDGVLYITADNRRAVLFDYNVDNGSFVSREISVLSDDLYSDGLIDKLVYQEENGLVLMKRDHALAGINSSITALSITRETGITAHSVVTVPKPLQGMAYNPISNKLFLTYKYDNRAVYGLWDIKESLIANTSFLKVSQFLSNGTPLTTWTYDYGQPGDEICSIDAEGIVSFDTLDGSKQFTTAPTMTVTVGFCYSARVCPMPIEAGQQWGAAQMGVKRVDTVSTRFLSAFSYKIRELNSSFIEEQTLAQTSVSGVTPFTGTHEVKLSASPNREQVICVENDRPEPFVVLGMSFRGVSNDG